MSTDKSSTQKAFNTAYSKKTPVKISFSGIGRTKQSMQAECDINNIMAKYQRTGLIDFVNRRQAHYSDVRGADFQQALNVVANAQELFSELPSSWRKRFDNDPAVFLEFVNNPDNRQEALKLGLIKPESQRPLEPPQRREGDSDEPEAKSTGGQPA